MSMTRLVAITDVAVMTGYINLCHLVIIDTNSGITEMMLKWAFGSSNFQSLKPELKPTSRFLAEYQGWLVHLYVDCKSCVWIRSFSMKYSDLLSKPEVIFTFFGIKRQSNLFPKGNTSSSFWVRQCMNLNAWSSLKIKCLYLLPLTIRHN